MCEPMQSPAMSPIAPVAALLQDDLARDGGGQLAVIPLVVRGPLKDALRRGAYAADVRIAVVQTDPEVLHVGVARRLRSGRVVEAECTAWGHDDRTALLATSAQSDALEKAVAFLLRRCYPLVIRPVLSAGDLCRIVTEAAESHRWTVRNELAVARPPGRGGARIEVARPERDPMLFTQLLQELSDHARVLEQVRFACYSPRRRLEMRASLSRHGLARLYHGELQVFADTVVEPMRCCALRKYAEMSGRNKTQSVPYGRPVTITFDRPLLAERDELERLCDVLSAMEDASICVFHLNPHLHLTVLDYADASALDLFMTGPSSLRVIPGHRTSEASLLRVCDRIRMHYEEATLQS